MTQPDSGSPSVHPDSTVEPSIPDHTSPADAESPADDGSPPDLASPGADASTGSGAATVRGGSQTDQSGSADGDASIDPNEDAAFARKAVFLGDGSVPLGAVEKPELSVVITTHDNLAVLRECLASWKEHASGEPVELIVVEDGCTDGTAAFLAAEAATDWGARHLRWVHLDNVHELMSTNRGIELARAPLAMSWHDDMFVRAPWFVPELVRTFAAYSEIGLLALSRGLTIRHLPQPVETWHDSVDWKRVQSTIGPAPLNWVRIQEVDAVMRPWVVRRECTDEVGLLDEAFRPTEWDEADLCYRIRSAGWKIATHGFERGGAYHHLVNTTYGRTASEARMALGLRNARLFFGRWHGMIEAESGRRRKTWLRRATPAGWLATARSAAGRLVPRRGT